MYCTSDTHQCWLIAVCAQIVDAAFYGGHFLMQGQYDSEEDFAALDERLYAEEAALPSADRMFYLSIPPNIFTAVAASASKAASSRCTF